MFNFISIILIIIIIILYPYFILKCDLIEEQLKETGKTFSPEVRALYDWEYVRDGTRHGRYGTCHFQFKPTN